MSRSKKGIGTPVAILIAALFISASVLFATRVSGLGVARTVTRTLTSSAAPSSIPLHLVTFNETGTGCGSYEQGVTFAIDYVPSWYVTLGNVTIVQPSNATLPLPQDEGQNLRVFAMISKIAFTVPDGSYPYHVSLGQDGTYDGTAIVDGSDVVVQVIGPLCG
jgi:hypothetical protein